MTNYQGSAAPYSCMRVYKDNAGSGHPVGIRQGRSDSNGFGLLHALRDHNVDEETIGTVIFNSSAGLAQGNDRFLYGFMFRTDGQPQIAVEVIEVRQPSNEAPDKYILGVVTAYCKGRGVVNGVCPDWVNATVP